MTPSAILFDLDGVIIDSEPLHEEALQMAFDRYSLEVPPTLFMDVKGRTDLAVCTEIMRANPGLRLNPEEIVAYKKEAYHGMLGRMRLIAGVRAFLDKWQARVPLAVTTSATQASQSAVFERFGLAPYFRTVVAAEDIVHPKPHPEPYRETARRLGLAPETCLVIEDSVNGVRSGVSAGCRVAGLTTSFPAAVLLEAGAHTAQPGYEALDAWLEDNV